MVIRKSPCSAAMMCIQQVQDCSYSHTANCHADLAAIACKVNTNFCYQILSLVLTILPIVTTNCLLYT